jgi:aminoglycoside phosphotransferase (APT) family kinase protein
MSGPPGVDVERLTEWAATGLPDCRPPFRAELLAGGRSNLTYRVTDSAGRVFALRRPPLHGVLPTAHDMAREHRIISALAGSDVPVPPALALCEDADVLGAPFYVMNFVDGTVLTDENDAAVLSLDARRRVSEGMADLLVTLHDVDVDAVGLGDLAKREDYVARQLKRWLGQFGQVKTREIPSIERAHALLVDNIPEQQGATIVHGDFRLGNVIAGDDGEIRALLDWELCTLGDPLADVGYLAICWPENDRESAAMWGPNRLPGFLSKAELLDRYATASGRSASNFAFYVSLAYWRLGCILEGVYSRSLAGAQGDKDVEIEATGARPPILGELAEEWARRAVEHG